MLNWCVFTSSNVQHDLIIWVIWRVSYMKQELRTLREYMGSSRPFVGSVLLIYLVFCVGLCVFCLSSFCVLRLMFSVSINCPSWLHLRLSLAFIYLYKTTLSSSLNLPSIRYGHIKYSTRPGMVKIKGYEDDTANILIWYV